MTPGLSKDIGVMYDHTFLNLQITRSGIRPNIKWVVSLVITYGHFSLGLCGCVWVNILTLFTTLRVQIQLKCGKIKIVMNSCQPGDYVWSLQSGFVWVCMGKHTHFIYHPEGTNTAEMW